jgi:hypothetical protein
MEGAVIVVCTAGKNEEGNNRTSKGSDVTSRNSERREQ